MVVKHELAGVPQSVQHVCVVRARLSGAESWVLETADMTDLDRRVLTRTPSCLDHEARPGKMVLVYYGKVDHAVLKDGFGYDGSSPFREKAMKYLNDGYTVVASTLVNCNSPINLSVLGKSRQRFEIIDTIPLNYLVSYLHALNAKHITHMLDVIRRTRLTRRGSRVLRTREPAPTHANTFHIRLASARSSAPIALV